MHFGRTWRLLSAALTAGVIAAALPPSGATAAPQLRVGDAQAAALAELAKAEAGTFGGATFEPEHGTLTIRYARTAGRAKALSRLSAVTAGATSAAGGARWRVEVVAVEHSLADLNTVKQKLGTDATWRSSASAVISEWYVDVPRNLVAVGVTRLTPQVEAAARSLFGAKVGLHIAERSIRHSRTDDWAPWAGGIRIRNGSGGGGCSSGFAIRNVSTGLTRMVTAGHCFALSERVTNGDSAATREVVGAVVSRTLVNNGLDVEYIAGLTYAPWTYKGSPTSDLGDNVRGAVASQPLNTLCVNGATTGEACGIITTLDACVFFADDGITTCHLNKLTSSNPTLSQPGDSGGNLFRYDAQGLKIGGIIIGGRSDRKTTWYHPYNVLIPSGWVVHTA